MNIEEILENLLKWLIDNSSIYNVGYIDDYDDRIGVLYHLLHELKGDEDEV